MSPPLSTSSSRTTICVSKSASVSNLYRIGKGNSGTDTEFLYFGIRCLSPELSLQRSIAAEIPGKPRHDQDRNDCSDAAGNNREDWPKEVCNQAGFKSAKLIRCSNEQRVQGGNTPAHVVGCEHLNQSRANDDAEVIARAQQEEHRHREPKAFRQAENHGDRSKAGDREKQRPSRFPQGTVMSLNHGHAEGADGRCCHQPA